MKLCVIIRGINIKLGSNDILILFQVHDCRSMNSNCDGITTFLELVQLVLQDASDNGIHSNVKQTFLTVTRTFYYTANSDTQTIIFHIHKVLFQRVN